MNPKITRTKRVEPQHILDLDELYQIYKIQQKDKVEDVSKAASIFFNADDVVMAHYSSRLTSNLSNSVGNHHYNNKTNTGRDKLKQDITKHEIVSLLLIMLILILSFFMPDDTRSTHAQVAAFESYYQQLFMFARAQAMESGHTVVVCQVKAAAICEEEYDKDNDWVVYTLETSTDRRAKEKRVLYRTPPLKLDASNVLLVSRFYRIDYSPAGAAVLYQNDGVFHDQAWGRTERLAEAAWLEEYPLVAIFSNKIAGLTFNEYGAAQFVDG